jgi:hypothetical protein
MSQQDDQAVVLLDFAPDRPCPKDMNEQIDSVWHQTATIGWPCWTDDPAKRVWREHLCRKCMNCGHAWCEQTADAYPAEEQQQPAGEHMSIRKTASGEVTAVEPDDGITKTAAMGWEPEDEDGLAAENEQADQG